MENSIRLINMKCGAATDIGRKRKQNQDSYAANAELGLFLVADGMGGHRGGETASSLAAEVIPKTVAAAIRAPGWNPKAVITEAIKKANETIYQHARQRPELLGMGTTTTAVLFKDHLLTIGHVGDSRCYLFRPERIWQATRDHSLVQEKLRAGLITREQARTDQMKNVITRSVGFEEHVDVEIYQMHVRPGDSLMLCSDGLSGLVEDEEIAQYVQKHLYTEKSIDKTVEVLIQAANNNGGDDNITAVMIEIE